ncbi:MAG: DUF4837 family protein [Ignavibacteriales bacterium]|nr:DUF4837 family protein [Ignavibacteriales bacterium]
MKTKIFKITNYFLAFCFVAVLFACGLTKKEARGNEHEIYVVADSLEFLLLEENMKAVFEKIIYTPQPEPLFKLIRLNFTDFESAKNKKNVIIISALGSQNKVSNYISNVLDTTVKQLVFDNEEYVFNKHDLWVNNQLVMFLTSPTIEQLNANITSNEDNLLHFFQNISNKRMYQNIYNSTYERKEVEAQLLKEFGWVIYVQADFVRVNNRIGDNFVWLRRAPDSEMERWIFVYWIDNASPNMLHPDSIITLRNQITERHYRTKDDKTFVEVAEDYRTFSEVNFNERYAIMTQGLWRMQDKSMGGPFINYMFFDEKTERIYMIDGSVFAPNHFKRSIIQQVDVTLQSFRTDAELDPDWREDLLDELD